MPVFVITEFAEHTPGEASANLVLKRLFEKLELNGSFIESAAVALTAKKQIPGDATLQSAGRVKKEISDIDPQVIVCFGARSLRVLEVVRGAAWLNPPEIGELPPDLICGNQRRIFVMPSARELEAFPEWRAEVWRSLQCLKAFAPPA